MDEWRERLDAAIEALEKAKELVLEAIEKFEAERRASDAGKEA